MKKSISGIRGIFGEDLNLKDVLEFCDNFSHLIESQKCVIGKDTRLTGNMIKETASAVLMKNGINVFDLQTAPTPVIFREARKYGAGLIISASHNPLEWNGMKFIINGRGINEQELEKIVTHQGTLESEIKTSKIITSSYINDAKEIIGNVNGKVNLVADIGGGAAYGFASNLLKEIGCNVKVINEKLSESSRGPDPTADNLTDLCAASKNADIGFAYDLDGDRLIVVKDGIKQTPDVTLGLGVAKALELGYKRFVLSIDSSISIEKFIKEHGGITFRSKVGEANLIDLLLKKDAQAGGEGSSGGFILPEFNYCRDGILTSGLIAAMPESQFNGIINYMKNYHQIRTKIVIDSTFHDKVIKQIESKFSAQYSEIDTQDGIKAIIDENSWVLVRRSNTEDVIRVSAESNDKTKCEKIIKNTLEAIKYGYEQIR